MAAGPIGTCWGSGTWADTTWGLGTWGSPTIPVTVAGQSVNPFTVAQAGQLFKKTIAESIVFGTPVAARGPTLADLAIRAQQATDDDAADLASLLTFLDEIDA